MQDHGYEHQDCVIDMMTPNAAKLACMQAVSERIAKEVKHLHA